MHSENLRRKTDKNFSKYSPNLAPADKIMYFFPMIFTLFLSLIFEGVSDGKTFICTLLSVGLNLSTAQTQNKARYGFVF